MAGGTALRFTPRPIFNLLKLLNNVMNICRRGTRITPSMEN